MNWSIVICLEPVLLLLMPLILHNDKTARLIAAIILFVLKCKSV